jgi:hypothetical protein
MTLMPQRLSQCVLVATTLAASWLAMMVLHESGHVLHAFVSGGNVTRVVLHPLAFSRTDISPNPHPLFVAWGGAIWGAVIPLYMWLLSRRARLSFLLRFFAGFCLTANGVYLAAGILLPVGDSEDLLRLGTARWALPAAGLPLVVAGLACWNGLSPQFGSGGQPVDRLAVRTTAAALAVLLAGMVAWSALT